LHVVHAALDARAIDEVKGLALRLTALPGVVAFLGVSGARTQLVFARSEDVSVDLKSVFDAALAALGGGKGGGGRVLMGSAGAADSTRLAEVLDGAGVTTRALRP
jgi:hypothetical protein